MQGQTRPAELIGVAIMFARLDDPHNTRSAPYHGACCNLRCRVYGNATVAGGRLRHDRASSPGRPWHRCRLLLPSIDAMAAGTMVLHSSSSYKSCNKRAFLDSGSGLRAECHRATWCTRFWRRSPGQALHHRRTWPQAARSIAKGLAGRRVSDYGCGSISG
jgi:hypothetical protein